MTENPALPVEAAEILRFWFGADSLQSPLARKEWFAKDMAFDAAIGERFAIVYQRAAGGGIEDWRAQPGSALAYVLLFDQFPRNMFRDTAQAFATDPKALSCAKAAVAAGFDDLVPPLARVFFYLPFEHSERLADQRYGLKLFGRLTEDPELQGYLDFARRHTSIIERFGRFPHRNAVLGRTSTPEEDVFLREPGSGF